MLNQAVYCMCGTPLVCEQAAVVFSLRGRLARPGAFRYRQKTAGD